MPVKIVVEEESAVLRLPGSRERREALNADHSEMCKIGTKGAIYEGVAGKLRDMVDEALTEYESNTAAGAQNDVCILRKSRTIRAYLLCSFSRLRGLSKDDHQVRCSHHRLNVAEPQTPQMYREGRLLRSPSEVRLLRS